MRILTKPIVVLCISSLLSSQAHARVSKEYIQWLRGEYEIPAEIQKVTSVSELRPFLDEASEFTRMAAARRLGEIEGPNSVDLLTEVYEAQPPTRGLGAVPLVKLEVIRTFGRIRTGRAKSSLLGMLKHLWKKGPVLAERRKEKRYFYRDRDFARVMPLLLETLYEWSGDKEVLEVARAIALSEDVRNVYRGPESIGQRAWEICLKGEMINKGVVEEEDSAKYLLDFVDDIRKKGLDSVELGPVKGAAAGAILRRHSETTLSSLISEHDSQLKKEPRDPKGSSTERHHILRRRIGV